MDSFTIELSFDEHRNLLAVYIRLARGKVARTKKISSGFLVDLDKNGHLLGVEMLQPGKLNIGLVRKVAKEYSMPVLNYVKPQKLAAAFG